MSDNEQLSMEPEPQSPEPARPVREAPPGAPSDSEKWQRDLLNRLAFASLIEQRRTRRWNIAFKAALLIYLFTLLIVYLPEDVFSSASRAQHTALVDVRGVIADNTEASADRIITGLRAAFEDENTVGVIMRINSPGGSPVQAGYINDEVRRLRTEYPEIPLYAVITDIGASGGYFIAASADKIYASKSSIVGSIGVLMNGFGFVDTLHKLGVERRLLTAGSHKGFLDPFSPTKPDEIAHVQEMLDEIHRHFIDAVKLGRGDRLADDDQLFSGLVWSGEECVTLGLVDALGSSSYVAREVIGVEEIVDFTPGRSYLEQIAERFGAAMAASLGHTLGLDAAPVY